MFKRLRLARKINDFYTLYGYFIGRDDAYILVREMYNERILADVLDDLERALSRYAICDVYNFAYNSTVWSWINALRNELVAWCENI